MMLFPAFVNASLVVMLVVTVGFKCSVFSDFLFLKVVEFVLVSDVLMQDFVNEIGVRVFTHIRIHRILGETLGKREMVLYPNAYRLFGLSDVCLPCRFAGYLVNLSVHITPRWLHYTEYLLGLRCCVVSVAVVCQFRSALDRW